MKQKDSWESNEGSQDAVWKALGEASSAKASGSFTDDVVRSVRLIPERESVLVKFFKLTPVIGLAACVVFAFSMFLNEPSGELSGAEPESSSGQLVVQPTQEAKWEQIENMAEVEMLVAAVDHLDEFSDHELVTMIGL